MQPENAGVPGFIRQRQLRDDLSQAASSRASSVSNSKHNCAASSCGSQFVICGKMVR
jgi:hypothetical protein